MQRQSVRDLPPNRNPVGTRCIQIFIPDDDEWERDLYGEVSRLALWMLWERDVTKSGKPVADRWLRAIKTWRHCDGSPLPTGVGLMEDFELPLRVDCDCNVFVTCCDGTEKQILTSDQVKALMSGQPGPGSEQPQPGGGCVTYHGVMGAAGPWYVPTVFNSGDTIEFVSFDGVTFDGGGIDWRCADGGLFFAGANTGVKVNDPGDPINTTAHQKIIASINGTFYDVFPGPFTIPGGISNGQMQLQINDSDLSNDAGTLTFDLKVCNQQDQSWTSIFSFELSDYGALIHTLAYGQWTAGQGYTQTIAPGAGGMALALQLLGAPTVTSMVAYYAASAQVGGSAAEAFYSDAGYYGGNQAGHVGTGLILSHGEPTSLSNPGFQVFTGDAVGTCSLQSLHISGTGTKPADWP